MLRIAKFYFSIRTFFHVGLLNHVNASLEECVERSTLQHTVLKQEKDDVHNTEKAISDEKAKRNEIISGYAKNNNIVHQLIDLALLQNGMLKGASLDAFLKRSVDMIK